jgi:type IV pilus assembly protein PilC
MPDSDQQQFEYQATNDAGEVITGQIAAESVLAAAQQLKERGLSVHSIQQRSTDNGAAEQYVAPSSMRGNGSFSSVDDRTLPLASHFEGIFEQRESLISALSAVQYELPPGPTRREIGKLIGDIRRAVSATDLSQTKTVVEWMPFLVSTSSAATGRWGDLITRSTSEIDRRRNRRRMIAYPFAIAAIGLLVLLFLCVYLLPTFAEMYDEFELELPWLTRSIFGMSDFVIHHPIGLLVSFAITLALTYGIFRLWTHYALTTRLLGVVISGDSHSVVAMSSLTGQLAELADAKLSLPDALWIAGQGCRHYHFKRVAEQLSQDVRDSTVPVRDCVAARHLPRNVVDALDAVPTPNVALLRELSTMYAKRADRRTDWASGAIAPAAIVFLGVLVGTIVVGLFMPMVDLIQQLT